MSLQMTEFEQPGFHRVVHVKDTQVGLEGYIAIHSVRLGPALGGTRIHAYQSNAQALKDVLSLAEAMTYKAAIAGTETGGGKSCIILQKGQRKTREMLLSFGRAIDLLSGEYFTAEDVGCSPADLAVISEETPFVTGLEVEGKSGNPAAYTAFGTAEAISVSIPYFSRSKGSLTIAIQGLGAVGMELARILFWQGHSLTVADIDRAKTDFAFHHFGARVVDPDQILFEQCDILAPCALGGVISSEILHKLRCKAIIGCANNQLAHDETSRDLEKRGILYAPDFIVNAGGLISVARDLDGPFQPEEVRNKVKQIGPTLEMIYKSASLNNISPLDAAMKLADYRLKYNIGRRVEPTVFGNTAVKR